MLVARPTAWLTLPLPSGLCSDAPFPGRPPWWPDLKAHPSLLPSFLHPSLGWIPYPSSHLIFSHCLCCHLTYYWFCLLTWVLSTSSRKLLAPRSRDLYLSCLPPYSQHLELWLAHRRHSNIYGQNFKLLIYNIVALFNFKSRHIASTSLDNSLPIKRRKTHFKGLFAWRDRSFINTTQASIFLNN